jgi:hypothetical protein
VDTPSKSGVPLLELNQYPSSIWRTISTPVQDCPLALCDFRTVEPEDLVSADIIFPHYQDEAYEVLYNPDQRWFYKKRMDWDDVLLFKLGDNSPDEAPCKLALTPDVLTCLTSLYFDSLANKPKYAPTRHSWTLQLRKERLAE